MDDDLEEMLGKLNGKVCVIRDDLKTVKEKQSEQEKALTKVDTLLRNHIKEHELDWKIVSILVGLTAIVTGVIAGVLS